MVNEWIFKTDNIPGHTKLCITLRHTIPYHLMHRTITLAYYIIPYHATMCKNTKRRTPLNHLILVRIPQTSPNYTIPQHTILYHTIHNTIQRSRPHHTILYHTLPYHTIPKHTIPKHDTSFTPYSRNTILTSSMYFICGAFNQHMSQFGLNDNNIFLCCVFSLLKTILERQRDHSTFPRLVDLLSKLSKGKISSPDSLSS